jgi:RimJ/RimL family protein N-acetyltransferase
MALVTRSPIFQIPQLTTDRLLLRGFRPEDFERYAEMMADDKVAHHRSIATRARSEAERFSMANCRA